ncbi:hypothetical protein B0T26DRAFT_651161 [Lasiosphaeria miniovina]|uniref:Short-chain dehydrogenase/reductase 3 n=1 Tax=Lasiosphaeria miniovina TaxID=1954250 RepID=A0AA40DUX4_9PEZI|nr:uncharacterized protein B0T26DRAFT_651161 [Lasiosphaeria miniovina]KAK0714096.1 hypothetical protein B0T26DRAFT_651161 [Lasiosphaeria miniovina]
MASAVHSPLLGPLGGLSSIVLSPFFSGPLLVGATYYPETLRNAAASVLERLPEQLGALLSRVTPDDYSTAMTVLKVAVALGVIGKVNSTLSTMAHNSWRLGPAKGWDWPKEIAVVTGGASGIGKDTTLKLAALGVRVAVLDIQDLPKDMQGNASIRFYHCDVTSTESVAAAADAIRSDFGNPSILVNNAGVAQPKPILKTDPAFLRTIFGVNLISMWFTTQQFLPSMIEQNKGHVVTVASIASFVALATAADYSATKAGALAFHETLASELKHHYKAPDVLTTVVHPNFVRTPLIQDLAARLEKGGVRLLTSGEVADVIVDQIKSRRGAQRVIQSSATILAGLRAWPSWLQEFVRDIVGKGTAPRRRR